MRIGKNYTDELSHQTKNTKRCDRCGNDFSHGSVLLHLPFRKMYVDICNLCWAGLTFGLWSDFNKIVKQEKL